MGRAKTGEAISERVRRTSARRKLKAFIDRALKAGDLACWRRGREVLGYIEKRRVVEIAEELGVTRGSVNRWLQWYETAGLDGLLTGTHPGAPPELDAEQRRQLTALIEDWPQAAGYASGVWTGPMIGDLIEQRFGGRYHNHTVPRLLHERGFSLQRPRKRLARADAEAQAHWVRVRLPAIKEEPERAAAS